MKNIVRHTICPLLAAFIWGTAFSAQSIAVRYLPPFTITAARNLAASMILALVCLVFHRNPGKWKDLLIGGAICGTALFLAANLQQFALKDVSAGKAGFITTLYIVLVPVAGLFLKRPVGLRVWTAVAIAVVGMYFLCVTEALTVGTGEIELLLCAGMFTIQIMCIDHFANLVDNIALSAAEFLMTGILSLAAALLVGENATAAAFQACLGPMIYITLFSSCIAYTLQTVAQKGGNPAVISLLLSMESVFGVLGGMVILHESMTGREWLGCALMAVAVVLTQLPERKEKQKA